VLGIQTGRRGWGVLEFMHHSFNSFVGW
jgi:hypothetical protein